MQVGASDAAGGAAGASSDGGGALLPDAGAGDGGAAAPEGGSEDAGAIAPDGGSEDAGGPSTQALTASTVVLSQVQDCTPTGGYQSVSYNAPEGGYIDASTVQVGTSGCGTCSVSFFGPADKPTGLTITLHHVLTFTCESGCASCETTGESICFTVYGP